jgi:hypothetical protein
MRSFLLLFLIFSFALLSAGEILLLEGKYQNRNIYVQNGFDNGIGFCVYEVRINGRVTTDEVNSSAFEIDFEPFNLKIGDPVKIEIFHKESCIPRVLNPDALKSKPTGEYLSTSIDEGGMLNWKTKNESGSLPFIIEQFKWNKWVKVGEVTGIGSSGVNSYEYKILPHSGQNKFRIKQSGSGLAPKLSKPIYYTSTQPQPGFKLSKNTKEVIFSAETAYEIYDMYGKIVKRGYGVKVELTNLPKGNYFLCYDSITAEFEKTKK